ncbi:MAG: hypothetical protein LQ337_003710 [Flavoplaca oasis]|nr:MAG: hypothetical protein LQ337_003710 [Flavoplaca oasis]
MLKGIVINDLPLTFQHAVNITRNLGYQYLWIDSLCIIQDDPNDWAFESSTMSRVYSNSVLNIAALWGDDSHSGCFVERNPFVTEDCRIGTWKHGNVVVRSNGREHPRFLDFVYPAPLLKRAWVLQERLLSPRTLFYGPWELYWECGERVTHESEPEGTFDWGAAIRFRSMKETDLISRRTSPLGRLWRHILRDWWRHTLRDWWGIANDNSPFNTLLERSYDLWTDIRAEYWSSNLTYHSDILVAISGVTDVIEQKTGLHFVFGLCKEFLCSELLWKVENANVTARSTLSPTWSWASVEKAELSSAYHHLGQYKRHSIDATFHTWTDPVGDSKGRDPKLNSNCLRLRGPLLRTTLKRYDFFFNTNNDRLPDYGYTPDIHLPDTVDVVCLVVVERAIPNQWTGLMLVPSPHEGSTFERVGVWTKDLYTDVGELKITHKDIQSFRLI